MPFTATPLDGLLIFEPRVFEDSRGYFFEAYNQSVFEAEGLQYNFVQDNQSFSSYGVVRGLHYQQNPHAQCKLVRALAGRILDVAVDIRKNSATYGQVFSVELTAENKKQLLIPAGFAHGFSVLSETAVVMYKCDALYNKESEGGIIYNDPELAIDWQLPEGAAVVSDKDLVLPSLKECKNNF
ncbi:dTDP-4-dehydrorhamnose 3,5-epimerase [Niabella sp. 22666]|jgi:dTDP-4-dehydrorhamnose 3,5-epimerase|uniref:dTDP-4-dehydrorhamnose 3,5-epimerase n=1 Tax=Niabella sp. 22666 TaxID=3453954 RepID=UPI003F87644C